MEKQLQQLKRHEGFMPNAYLCTQGKQTIGYGRNLEDRGITEDEALYLLRNDLKYFTEQVESNINTSKCNPARKAVLVNMAFNLGISGLLKFKNTIAAVQAGQWETAAIEMLNSRWAVQVGSRADELADQMATGEWQL
ncbi:MULTISPECIES: glycoside hydrolase family protein [Pseudoalteromonas]|uniref:Lysozyme n=1 Tax=Pseudoalteromonas amylolytica TaxID=1859457 RepID=A0A1S1MXU9_9GAMM|nr:MULTISPECIES: glycoside hydrolase family protein [Pseudoalteromonas]OHU85496.1 glycoside hydrolase [Pseudoalteromonas sp. JW3]OHU91730.1 glycoside hydrolase [Pseudoalteromonas amylolytica]